MKCRSKKRHFEHHGDAHRRLAAIMDKPDPSRIYSPTAVVPCHCGGYVLTSKSGKSYASGKRGRRAAAKGRVR